MFAVAIMSCKKGVSETAVLANLKRGLDRIPPRAVTALGGILSNPLFKLANTAVSETPFLQDIIATANNIS